MSDSVLVRSATIADAADLARMVGSRDRFQPGNRSGFTAEHFLRDGIGDGAVFHTLLAVIGEEPSGYVIYYWGYDPHTASRGVFIADVYVEAFARRRGLGSALVRNAARQARENGGNWIFWTVLKRDRAARRFYRNLASELKEVGIFAAFGPDFHQMASLETHI